MIPQFIGRYEIRGRLGKGGMGSVYDKGAHPQGMISGRNAPSQKPTHAYSAKSGQPFTPKWLLGALGVLALTIVSLLIIIAVNLSSNNDPPAEPTIAQATPQPTISEKDGMILLYVPEGDFEMGAADDDPDASDHEKPRHTVYLNAYWIDQTEITNAMFATFFDEMGNQKEGRTTWLDDNSSWALIENVNDTYQPKDGFANHPVVEVSWYGANAYCQWARRRLPTEAYYWAQAGS